MFVADPHYPRPQAAPSASHRPQNNKSTPMPTKTKAPPVPNDIQHHLPDASPEQAARFAEQVGRLDAVRRFFEAYPEDRPDFEGLLVRGAKALDYKRPYRIAVIGTTGAGKSTLINALLCRELVLVKDIGKPATGAALEIFLDVPPNGDERAQVTYRDEANVRGLLTAFAERYDLEADLSGPLDEVFAERLAALEPQRDLGERIQREFEGLRRSLAHIVAQYSRHHAGAGNSLPASFSLSDPAQVSELMALVDEHSPNGPPSGLVHSVVYHVRPAPTAQDGPPGGLRLPGNVCLVDLPGLGGDPLHDIIISEGIKEADAVVFIVRPPRILDWGDDYLLDSVRRYVSLDGSAESAERIFLVLNAQDEITRDDLHTLENLPRDMHDLMELVAPGYALRYGSRGGEQPYFMTSAWMAYNAQKALGGGMIENPNFYEGKAVQFKVKPGDHRAVLEVSRIPALVDALTRFARERRIEGQIREGREALDRIIQALANKYSSEINLRTGGQGIGFFEKEDDRLLDDRQKELVRLVFDFRSRQLQRLDTLRQELVRTARRICDDIDSHLMEMMPALWKRSFVDSEYIPGALTYGMPIEQALLSDTELLLWQELTLRLKELADLLAHVYRQAIEDNRLPQSIVGLGYDHPAALAVADSLDTLIDGMHTSLAEISKRVALMILAGPRHAFITADGVQEKLKAAMGTLPRKREVAPADFERFIKAVREHYELTVCVFSINSLLNVYQYEMVHIETVLRDALDQLFKQLTRRIDADPALRDRVRAGAPNANRDKVDLLLRKRGALPPLSGEKVALNGGNGKEEL
jgi:hypothetical protein